MQIVKAAIVECDRPLCERVITVPVDAKMDETAAKKSVTQKLNQKGWGTVTIKAGGETIVKQVCKACAATMVNQFAPRTAEQIAAREVSIQKRKAKMAAEKLAADSSE